MCGRDELGEFEQGRGGLGCGSEVEPGHGEWDRSFGKFLLYLRNGRSWYSGG